MLKSEWRSAPRIRRRPSPRNKTDTHERGAGHRGPLPDDWSIMFVTRKSGGVLVTVPPEKDRTVIFINVFTVTQANQQRLVDLLTRATDGFVNRAPGFISATLHRSLDGTKG